MTQLQEAVAQVFAPQGGLALAEPAFTPRPGQTRMALAVAGAIEEGQVLVVEAGTGVGKTYAYLVPALLSGQRVLVSTATKALQDQLFARDLPRLVHGLGLPLRTYQAQGPFLLSVRGAAGARAPGAYGSSGPSGAARRGGGGALGQSHAFR